MEQKKKVLFIVPSLNSGGAQRTILNVVNYLDRTQFRPILVLYQQNGVFLNKLKEDIEVIDLKARRARFSVIKLARTIRKLNPHVILSTIRYSNAMTVLAASLARSQAPVVVRETNHFTAAGVSPTKFKEKFVGWSYRRAELVVALSEGVRQDVMKRYHVPPQNVCTIYNPIDLEEVKRMASLPLPEGANFYSDQSKLFRIIAVGHLKYQKGFDLLIQAVSRLKEIPLQLIIVGDGPEEKNLKELIQSLGISNQVRLIGYQDNPYAWMSRADLFVLSSRWEGFGHVITEAMACRVPVLATRCPSGPDEIISDGIDGRLCVAGSVEALVEGIREMWINQEKRKKYIEKASLAVERFGVQKIAREYERVFNIFCYRECDGSG